MADLLLTNRTKFIAPTDHPLSGLAQTTTPAILKRGPNGGLTRDHSFEGRGTFNVLPSAPLPSPVPVVADAGVQSLLDQQFAHKQRIIQYGISNNRPVAEVANVLKAYGYDKLKVPTPKQPQIRQDAAGFQRDVTTGARIFPDAKKKTSRSSDKILKDIRVTQSAIASRKNNQNFTEALLRTTYKDNPEALKAIGLGNVDASTQGLSRTLYLLKQEYQKETGKSFSADPIDTAQGKNEEISVSVSNNMVTDSDGRNYPIRPNGTIVYKDGTVRKVNR